ncbi:MAG: glycosyltransferase family 2 protein [Verrucomicrobia bacterium]|nr:glycosyltransferase family 2 protein [Verrucomicrobiota bacterium]
MTQTPPAISIVVPLFNAAGDYTACLDSLARQTRRDFEVIGVDSASTDGSADLIARDFPWVRLIREPSNLGYRGGARKGAAAATGRCLVIMNQDVECACEFLAELMRPLETDGCIGMTAPLILLYDRRDTVNEAGNAFHFSGLYGSRGLGDPREKYPATVEVGLASGCCFCIRRELWEALGGFSSDFDLIPTGWHAGNEDQDLCWRLRLAGFTIKLVPGSVLYHKYVSKPWSGARLNGYYCNYWLTLLRHYRWRTLVVLAPFGTFNLGLLWLKAATGGWDTFRRLGRTQWLLVANLGAILEMRRRVQARRKVPDREIVAAMETTISVSTNAAAQQSYLWLSRLYHWFFRRMVVLLGA